MAAGDLSSSIKTMQDMPCNVFDGADDYVEIPHNANQLGANLSNGFTISAWINPKGSGESGGKVFDKSTGTAGQNGIQFGMEDADQIQLRVNNSTNRVSANGSISLNVWQHILVTVTSDLKLNFYINGAQNGTVDQVVSQTLSTITTTNAVRIGNRSAATDRSFDGGISRVKMWNRVLSAAEIAEDYAGNVPTSGLIHYFKLGGDYTDYGSVGVTATNSGSYSNVELAQRIKADIDKTNIAAATDMEHLTILLNYDRMDVCQVIEIERAAA